jgi:hypothetical protein
MRRTWFRTIATAAAGFSLAGAAMCAEQAEKLTKVPFAPRGFYQKYVVPRVDSTLQGEIVAAGDYVNPNANPWTKDHLLVHRVEADAIRAGKNAMRQYLLDTFKVDTWSVPLFQSTKANPEGPAPSDTRARLRFGVSHLTPRAALDIPNAFGHVALGADAKGAVNAMFESHSYTFRVEASYDPREHLSTFTLGRRF